MSLAADPIVAPEIPAAGLSGITGTQKRPLIAADFPDLVTSRPGERNPAAAAVAIAENRSVFRRVKWPSWLASLAWLSRSRRVLLLLGGVWVLNAFDLGYTMLESTRQHFVELNPVASALLKGPDHWIVAYKAGLVIGGSSILLALRRFALAEYSCWLLFGAYCYVGGLWSRYYQELLVTLCDPAQSFMLIGSP